MLYPFEVAGLPLSPEEEERRKREKAPGINPVVVDYLLKQREAQNQATSVPEVPVVPEKQVEAPVPEPVPVNKPSSGMDWKDVLALSLAGAGDAVSARGGRQTQFLKGALDVGESIRRRGLEDEELAKKRELEKDLSDPNSITSKTWQEAAEQITEKPVGSFSGISARQISNVFPALKELVDKKKAEAQIRMAEATLGIRKDTAETTKTKAEEDLKLKKEQAELERKKLENEPDKAFMATQITAKTKTLDEMKPAAQSAKSSLGEIERFEKLLRTDTTGMAGKIKAELAPIFQTFGVDWKSADEAAIKEALGRTIIGKMRLDLIGPGPVSEWEQKLLSKMAAGGSTTLEAAKALTNQYRNMALNKINAYNSEIDSAVKVFPKFGETYQKIEIGGQRVLSAEDQAALKWANENPNDPDAIEIKRRLGVEQ